MFQSVTDSSCSLLSWWAHVNMINIVISTNCRTKYTFLRVLLYKTDHCSWVHFTILLLGVPISIYLFLLQAESPKVRPTRGLIKKCQNKIHLLKIYRDLLSVRKTPAGRVMLVSSSLLAPTQKTTLVRKMFGKC